jgi:hypothetical protein
MKKKKSEYVKSKSAVILFYIFQKILKYLMIFSVVTFCLTFIHSFANYFQPDIFLNEKMPHLFYRGLINKMTALCRFFFFTGNYIFEYLKFKGNFYSSLTFETTKQRATLFTNLQLIHRSVLMRI